MWSSDDATALLIYIVFTYWQPAMTMNAINKSWYDKNRKQLSCSVPSYAFGIVWILMFALISASGFLYLGPSGLAKDSTLFISGFVVFVVNVILTKVWYPIFFGKTTKQMGLALFIAIMIELSAIAMLIFMILDKSFVAVGLYAPYVGWAMYAVYLNYRFYTFKPSSEKPTIQEKSPYMVSRKQPPRSTYSKRERKVNTKIKTQERKLDIV